MNCSIHTPVRLSGFFSVEFNGALIGDRVCVLAGLQFDLVVGLFSGLGLGLRKSFKYVPLQL